MCPLTNSHTLVGEHLETKLCSIIVMLAKPFYGIFKSCPERGVLKVGEAKEFGVVSVLSKLATWLGGIEFDAASINAQDVSNHVSYVFDGVFLCCPNMKDLFIIIVVQTPHVCPGDILGVGKLSPG